MAALAYGSAPGSPVNHLVAKAALPNAKIHLARGIFDDIPHPRPHKTDTYVRIERGSGSADVDAARQKWQKRFTKKRRNQKRQEWADEGIFDEDDSLVDIIADESGIEIAPNASPAFKRSSSSHRHHAARSHSHVAKRAAANDEWLEQLEEDLPYGDAVLSSEEFLQDNVKRAAPHRAHHTSDKQAPTGGARSSKAAQSGSASGSASASSSGSIGSAESSVASASAAASSAASSQPPPASKWVNGATGLMYAQLANGSSTVITSASNVYVIEGGGDTSNGDPLLTQIVTQHNQTDLSSLFWLVDTTGDFCTNNATNLCFITLGDGYNDSPFSLVPYDLGLNGNVRPIPMWSINATTGMLTGTWANNTAIQFTQNDMLEGNGDIDAYPTNETIQAGFLPVSLYLQ